jgi:AAA+ superfamily predicted ATPase
LTNEHKSIFALEEELPTAYLTQSAKRLIGFSARYERLHTDLRLLIDPPGLATWSQKHYGKKVPIVDTVLERYPLVIFHGDVGTGKTVTAEAITNSLTKELKRPGILFKLSTQVRGSGNVGEMSTLINRAFETVIREAAKSKHSFLIIDEADSLAATRDTSQSHHEDKVAVNTLIQKLDDVRRHNGRVLVFLCTNRFASLDPAIVRRAGYTEEFKRPDDLERKALFDMDCAELDVSAEVIGELVRLTGPSGPHGRAFTFSDLRTRVLPEALRRAFPTRKISADDLLEAVRGISPSPMMTGS